MGKVGSQCSAQPRALCVGGQFLSEGALGAAGAMLKIVGTFTDQHVNSRFGK